MIDYRTHLASLSTHAARDGVELTLLERSAVLWEEGLQLYATVGQIRDDIQTTLAHPTDPTATETYRLATKTLRVLAEQLQDKHLEIARLATDIRAMNHVRDEVDHPELLDLFQRPAAPNPLPRTIIAQGDGDPASPPTVHVGEARGAFWLGVLAYLGFSVLLDEPSPSQAERYELAGQSHPVTAGQFADAVVPQQLTELAVQLYEFQQGLWEAFGKAKAFLTDNGLRHWIDVVGYQEM